jgi:hypothetical protein
MVGQVAGGRTTIWAVVRIGIVAAFALKGWLPRGITVRGARLIEEIRTYGRRQVLLAMLISVVAHPPGSSMCSPPLHGFLQSVSRSVMTEGTISCFRAAALQLPTFATATKASTEATVSILHDSRKLNRRQSPFSLDRRD